MAKSADDWLPPITPEPASAAGRQRVRGFVFLLTVRLLAAAFMIGVTVAIGFYLVTGRSLLSSAPAPAIIATADCPDGPYRCVVTEQPPPYGSSPWRYTFTIQRRDTGQPLPGDPYTFGNDSCGIDDFRLQWSDETVTIKYNGDHQHTGQVLNGQQVW